MIDLFGKKDVQKEAGATQQFVEVKEIREGVVILKSGGLRMLVGVSSINFALKGADEQTAIITQFQEFLNSLDFSIQIAINSRKLDIEPYLNLLNQIAGQQTNELLKIQTQEYIEFIRTMVQSQNIMSKSFYVVTPYDRPVVSKQMGEGDVEASFLKDRNQLLQRANHVMLGLRRVGLKTWLLESQDALNLMAQLYHPSVQMKELNLPTAGLVNYS